MERAVYIIWAVFEAVIAVALFVIGVLAAGNASQDVSGTITCFAISGLLAGMSGWGLASAFAFGGEGDVKMPAGCASTPPASVIEALAAYDALPDHLRRELAKAAQAGNYVALAALLRSPFAEAFSWQRKVGQKVPYGATVAVEVWNHGAEQSSIVDVDAVKLEQFKRAIREWMASGGADPKPAPPAGLPAYISLRDLVDDPADAARLEEMLGGGRRK